MNVTFLIGNGFDLNLGLKTQYTDFYKYYCRLEKSQNDMIASQIDGSYGKWSDLEMGLADFVNTLEPNQIKEFVASKVYLEEELVKYLKIQEARLLLPDQAKAAGVFRQRVLTFYKELNSEWQDEYITVLQKANGSLIYQFVDFNYTNTLDRLVELCQKRYDPFSSHRVGGSNYTDTIRCPLHIHGTLTKDLILGIDSIEQIQNLSIRRERYLANYFVKSQMNQALGEKRTERFKKMIDQSQYIYLYGLSCGDSDQLWWKYIIQWLQKHPLNRLIICVYKAEYASGSAARKLQIADEQRSFFLNQGMCDANLYENIKDKIHIIINSQIFSLDCVQVMPEKSEENGNCEIQEELVGAV